MKHLLVLLACLPLLVGARLFDGVDDYLNNTSAVITATPATFACWMRTSVTVGSQIVLTSGISGSNLNRFTLSAEGGLAGDPIQATVVGAAPFGEARTSTGFSTNTWHHAAAVFTSSTSRTAYIDGGSAVSETTSVTPSGNNQTRIGIADQLSFSPFTGDISECAIWSSALSAEEIASLAKGFSPALISPQTLEAHWRLFGNSDPEPDIRGGFNMTVTNGPTKSAQHRIFGAD